MHQISMSVQVEENATTTLTVSTLRAATGVSVTLDMHPGAECAWVSHMILQYRATLIPIIVLCKSEIGVKFMT